MLAEEISLTMPVDLGAQVIADQGVQSALQKNEGIRVGSIATKRDAGGAFQDFGATAIAILATPAAAAAITGLFKVIKVAIEEAHKTRRLQYAQRHDLKKLVLSLGQKDYTINLEDNLQTIERRVTELENEAIQAL